MRPFFGRWLLPLFTTFAAAAGNPLVQSKRPPQQTTVQSAAQHRLVANAAVQSQAARAWVLDYLSNEVRQALQGTPLETASGEELLTRLDWEFRRLPLIHNGPMDNRDQASIKDDSDLQTTLVNGYLQNVCQRWALGATDESKDNLLGEHGVMIKYMGLPHFARADNDPTLREANNCVMYLATNLRKTHCGNFIYGSVTYVVNSIYRDKFAVSPFDTGAFAGRHQSEVGFGTQQDYYHLFKSHVTVLGYNFADIFKRWYIEGTPPPSLGDFPYFEIEWFGNAWLPESMLYLLVKFSGGPGVGLWGTDIGWTLRQFMQERRRPLLWADSDDSGILIDPMVNAVAGGQITDADVQLVSSHWSTGASWQDLYNAAPDHLKFVLPNYERRQICESAEQDAKNMVMGTDQAGNCVYWVWDINPSRWECQNDGTCVKSASDRGAFFTEQECLSNCGQGNWACVFDAPGSRAGSHHCEPNANLGQCANVDICEASCGDAATCSPGPPPGLPTELPTYT